MKWSELLERETLQPRFDLKLTWNNLQGGKGKVETMWKISFLTDLPTYPFKVKLFFSSVKKKPLNDFILTIFFCAFLYRTSVFRGGFGWGRRGEGWQRRMRMWFWQVFELYSSILICRACIIALVSGGIDLLPSSHDSSINCRLLK